MSDPLIERLAALPLAEPEAARAERTRVVCRARLAARRPGACAPSEHRVGPGLWRPAILVIGALYVVEAMAMALAIYERH